MRKLRLLESMLQFSLLASVVGFSLGVLAVFYFAAQIFELHPRSANPTAQLGAGSESREAEAARRTPEKPSRPRLHSPADQPPTRLAPASLPPASPPPAQAPVIDPIVNSRWPWFIVGTLAGLGVFLLVFLAWLQVRVVLNSQALLARAAAHPKSPEPPPAPRPVAQTNGHPSAELLARFAESLDRLEGRIQKLERTPLPGQPTFPPAPPPSPRPAPAPSLIPHSPPAYSAPAITASAYTAPQPSFQAPLPTASEHEANEAAKLRLGRALRTQRLLTHGEDFLKAENAKRALECFEEALTLEPNSVEGFIKKGNALERLGRLEDALVAYDQAIALDPNATMAYLFKGGVCNRLDRYEEALQCYQRALPGAAGQRLH